MITLRSLITPAIIATGLSFMSGQAFAGAKSEQIYIDNGSVKMKLSESSLSWQISLLHGDTGVVTNNIFIDLVDKDGFVIETLYSFCMQSKPFSLTLFRGNNTVDSDVKEIKTLVVKIKSTSSEGFCHGYGIDKGELQIVGVAIVEWIKTATLSEYLNLTTSN